MAEVGGAPATPEGNEQGIQALLARRKQRIEANNKKNDAGRTEAEERKIGITYYSRELSKIADSVDADIDVVTKKLEEADKNGWSNIPDVTFGYEILPKLIGIRRAFQEEDIRKTLGFQKLESKLERRGFTVIGFRQVGDKVYLTMGPIEDVGEDVKEDVEAEKTQEEIEAEAAAVVKAQAEKSDEIAKSAAAKIAAAVAARPLAEGELKIDPQAVQDQDAA